MFSITVQLTHKKCAYLHNFRATTSETFSKLIATGHQGYGKPLV